MRRVFLLAKNDNFLGSWDFSNCLRDTLCKTLYLRFVLMSIFSSRVVQWWMVRLL
jgi:hypothetical protein